MPRRVATLMGLVAILLWALLALFTIGAASIPPLQLNAMTFAVGGTIGAVWLTVTGAWNKVRGVSWRVYAFGTAGLFGYHFLYFSALRLADPAEASLIAYLWPLLIVLFSGLLPGERLGLLHILGALAAFSGAALIVGPTAISANPGLILAGLCALTWSGYSVVSRSLGDVPTETVAVFCLLTAVLSVPAHLFFEPTIWPQSIGTWASIIALGVGPVGLAFYVWDIGMKRGDIQFLGAASYAAPLLSTLVLIATGFAETGTALVLAALLITVGAALAAAGSRRLQRRLNK